MTHLDRFYGAIRRQKVDRAPCGFHATPEMWRALCEHTGRTVDQLLYEDFDVDRRGAMPPYTGRELRRFPDGTYESVWGVHYRDVSYGHGSYSEAVFSPLKEAQTIAQVEAHAWPSPLDYDFAALGSQFDSAPGYAYMVGYISLGWFAWELRSMEGHLEDLAANEAMADAVIQRIAQWGYEYFARVLSAGKPWAGREFSCIQLADDFGTQEGPMISAKQYRRFYQKPYRKLCDMAHAAGVLVEFHSCGGVAPLIPDLIDTGIDILNPLQTSAKGMDPEVLKREYGAHIAFSGGIDVQQVLPRVSEREVRDEVYRLLDAMARDGGYILEPSHAVQIGTPPGNVLAMFRALDEYYKG